MENIFKYKFLLIILRVSICVKFLLNFFDTRFWILLQDIETKTFEQDVTYSVCKPIRYYIELYTKGKHVRWESFLYIDKYHVYLLVLTGTSIHWFQQKRCPPEVSDACCPEDLCKIKVLRVLKVTTKWCLPNSLLQLTYSLYMFAFWKAPFLMLPRLLPLRRLKIKDRILR